MKTKRQLGQLILALLSFSICFSANAVPIKFDHTNIYSSTEDVVNFKDDVVGSHVYGRGKDYLSALYGKAFKHDFDHVGRTHHFEFHLPAGVVALLDDDLDVGRYALRHSHKKHIDDDDVAVREPESIALLGLGLVLLGFIGRLTNTRASLT